MKKILFMLALAGCCACQPKPQAPIAKVIPYELQEFDNIRMDNYHWMRLSDEQKNATDPDAQTQDVLDYLNAENDYLKSEMEHTQKLQDELFEELKGRMKQDDESVPYLSNGYYYWTKFETGMEYPFYYRRADKEGAVDQLLLDVNVLAEGKAFCNVSGVSVSPDNQLMAFATDYVSRRRYAIHFMDIATGALLGDSIANTTGGMVWANDNKTIFYITKDPQTLRNNRLYRYRLGTEPGSAQLCYEEKDETFNIGVGKTKSKKYIVLSSSQTLTSETLILDADKPEGTFKVFTPRSHNHLYRVDHINNTFYIHSNRDALNFKLMKTGENATEEKNWKAVIPHRADVLLENFTLFNDYLAVNERQEGLNKLRIINLKNGAEQFVPFAEEVYTTGFNANAEPGLKTLRYSYSSLTTPNSVYEYQMETQRVELIKETEVLGGFDKNNYETKRLWATAGDGVKIPISIVYRKGFKQDGNGKLLLYAYGSYGSSTNPSFNSNALSLLDRGFAYAIAHIRGGSEL
ncbi:MAG: oligopeptidase B, partial [Bacteroidales bacterium]|nr:oligopeptidase B [Bacteroidales bacterium]